MTSDCARKQKHQERTHACERRKALEWNRTLSRLTTVKTTAPLCFCLEEEEKTFSGRRQEASLVCWKGSRVCWRTSSSSRELSVDPQQTRTNRDEADDRVVSSLNRRHAVRPPIGRHHLPPISALCRTVAMGTVAHVAGSRQGNSSSPRLLTHFRSAMPRYR